LIGTRDLFLEGRISGFIDWQKAFDRVNWTKLMQILKGTVIDWRERRLISNLRQSMTEPRADKKCEDWKRSQTRILFVTNSVLLVQQMPYHGGSGRVQNRRANHSHCEIYR